MLLHNGQLHSIALFYHDNDFSSHKIKFNQNNTVSWFEISCRPHALIVSLFYIVKRLNSFTSSNII